MSLEEKKKRKVKVKRDACYHKVKSRYKVWPSAYASGALVKCRKVGAKNWGESEKNEELELNEQDVDVTPEELEDLLRDEGGAAGIDAFTEKFPNVPEDVIGAELEKMDNVGRHEDGDYILGDEEEVEITKESILEMILEELESVIDEKKRKLTKKPSSEKNLGDWFKRKGAKGKTGGWVDCNAPDGKGGYKPCGRQAGEKRKKYPACRPTPAACKAKGKGKEWGKKAGKKKNESLHRAVIKELQNQLFLPGLKHHVDNQIPVSENIYRIGSPCYFNVISQAREYYKQGLYEVLNEEERVLLENTNLGEFAMFEGEEVPLDFPMYEESLEEAEKKDPPIGKPTKNTGPGKKYKVYVRNPKTGNIKKITYGDKKGGLKGNWNNPEARASFAKRHKCADKKDRTKPGYWACRAHKDFGKNVPGRFW